MRKHFTAICAVALVVFNITDAIFTLILIHSGAAREANPLMKMCLEQSDAFFLLVKVGGVSLLTLFLWKYRERGTISLALTLCAGLYTLLFFYEIFQLITYL